MLNLLLEIIFKRKIKIAFGSKWLYKFRSFKDGIIFLNFSIDCDFYKGDHNPQISAKLAFLNFYIFYLELYNIYHISN